MATSAKKPTQKKAAAPGKEAAPKAVKATTKTTLGTKAASPAKAVGEAKAVATKPPIRRTVAAKRKAAVPHEQRRNYIEVAAYYIAERHGFTPGRELTDWAAAEAEIDRLLEAGLLNP